LGEGSAEVLALFDLGSSASFAARPCLERAFLLEPGLEEGVFRDFGGFGGLDSVEVCPLSTTGEAYLGVAVLDLL